MTSNPQSDVFAINYSVFDANYNPTPPDSGGSGLGGRGMFPVEWATAAPHTLKSALA